MYEFFISYSRKDINKIEPLIKILEHKGIKYFIDRQEIDYGASYANKIVEALFETEKVLFIWTENSDKADWVDKEIQYSINNRIPIIPIKIGKFKSAGMALALSNVNWCEIEELNLDNSEEIIESSLSNADGSINGGRKRKKVSTKKYIKGETIKKKEYDIDVFLTCDYSQISLAKKIARRLKQRGIRTFIDRNGVKKSKEQSLKLGKILNSSRVLLLLWDKSIEKFPLVNNELSFASGLNKQIVSYKFSEFESDEEFELLMENAKVYKGEGIDRKILLSMINYIDKLIPTEEKEDDLKKNIQDIILNDNESKKENDEEFFNPKEINIEDINEIKSIYESNEPYDYLNTGNYSDYQEEIDSKIEEDTEEDEDIIELETLKKLQEAAFAIIGLPTAILKDITKVLKIATGIRERKKKRKKIKKNHKVLRRKN